MIQISMFMVILYFNCGKCEQLPTLYEYYTKDGITTGLSDHQPYFRLNNKNITIYSGTVHYFRVHPNHWRISLRKLRACGLNSVETYIPWNLHNPTIGSYHFGEGNSDMEQFLDVAKFLKIAQEEDLLAIIRPGPFIDSEFEFGGLPSWLLRFDGLKIRTSQQKFMFFVEEYFKVLLSVLKPLQFTFGGPIIAFQIENEYGNTKDNGKPLDIKYLQQLRSILLQNGIVELLFTSDTPSSGFEGTLRGVLATANFQNDSHKELTLLKRFQPNKPLMVMEYWTGWFDHWTDDHHHTRSGKDFMTVLEQIINFNSSFNLYTFQGSTNFGFLNGGEILDNSTDNAGYAPISSSYDYDAPISENGDYTDKYFWTKLLIKKYNTIKTRLPKMPKVEERISYPDVEIIGQLGIEDLINQSDTVFSSVNLVPMEMININNNSGQTYGYIVYRKYNLNIPENSVLEIEGRICDTVLVVINGELVSKLLKSSKDLNNFGYWRVKNSTLNLGKTNFENATLDLIVENWGRINFGKLNQFNQHKGLWQGKVYINRLILQNWTIIPLEFKQSWTKNLKFWKKPNYIPGPALYKGILNIKDDVRSTYIDLRKWTKGFVIVNNFVLSRFFKFGPQLSAYLPEPFLKKGVNEILIFEHFVPSKFIKFCVDPIFKE